jgi:RNA polymerase sigma-70 factor (ECF subfamily)
MTAPTDAELIQRILERADEAAFRVLYRRHAPRLYQLHLRFAGGVVAEAEDLLQATWIRVARLLSAFRKDEALAPWLRGVAVNVAREWLRRRRREDDRHADVDPDILAIESGHPDDRIDLDDAIAALPAGFRAVLVLHDVEGFSHEEIAAQLGVAIGTSKSQLFDARHAMRRLLSPRPSDGREQHESA